MLQFALRLGAHPQMVATTTPRPIAVLEEAARRRRHRGDAGGDGRQRRQPGADVRRRDDAPLCRHGARAAGAIGRARRRHVGRAVASRLDRCASRRRRAGAVADRGCRRSAGDGDGDVGRVRHRRRRPRPRRARLRRRRSHAAGPRAAGVGAGGDRGLRAIFSPTAWSPRSTRAATSSSACCARSMPTSPCARCGRRAASGCAPSRSRRSMRRAAWRTSARFDALEDQMCAFGADGLVAGTLARPARRAGVGADRPDASTPPRARACGGFERAAR